MPDEPYYEAEVDLSALRQLYVNGKRRSRARIDRPEHAVDGDSDTAWVTSHETMGIFNVEDPEEYRYIRFKRPTSPTVSGIAELRVLAEE